MELKDRLAGLVRTLPPAQRAGLAVAAIVLIMAAVPFIRWVATPSYALLYAGLEDRELAEVTNELSGQGVDYELDGSRVMVPQGELHQIRANLAEAGVSATPVVPGYELLDDQALGLSDFRQRVDLQRAVEGELARTLTAMDNLESATVRLVMPEEALFSDRQTPPSASVLVRPVQPLDRQQIQAMTLLISSAVEGLDPDQVTVADTNGQVLHAPGDGTVGGVTDGQQQRTRDFEQALSTEISELLRRATDAPASVVVRAALDFDEIETQTETYDEGGAVPLREQTSNETYEGTGPAVGGIVGVDGGPLPEANGGEGNYQRDEATREFGVGRTVTRVVQAPGEVQRLSVALVVDEQAAVADGELVDLVSAAAGIDVERGDEIAITRVATPPVPEAPATGDGPGLVDLVQRIVALVVLVVIAVALFLMSRRRSKPEPEPEKVVPAKVRPQPQLEEQPEEIDHGPTVKDEVSELVEKQPEEIAQLLRGWLADRRVDA